MAKVLVYNNDTDRMETYYRGEDQVMPYVTNNTLKVGEFRGSSKSPTLWTDKRAMQSWNSFRYLWGEPINVGFAFKRPYEGGHGQQSQHYAGVAFDVAQGRTNEYRARMRNLAQSSGIWTYVEPVSISPTWVHFDRRSGTPACSSGYPALRQGSKGVYVLILQDGLNTLGFNAGSLDGVFGNNTRNAVVQFQQSRGLTADGIVGCLTWTRLQSEVVGKGRTSSVID